MRYGYARVSTTAQDHALQVEALKGAGCERVYTEKRSGKSVDGRKEFRRLLKAIGPGDVIVVTRLDRMARSSRDLLNVVHQITEAGAGFRSLKETWADSTNPAGRLMLTVLAGIAEFERELILERTAEGIAKARKQGKQFGRPSRLDAGQRRKIAERYADGATMAELAAEYECGEATIWRALQPAA
jgi:DNA invertase Pin-like site-specific DNA recombinase